MIYLYIRSCLFSIPATLLVLTIFTLAGCSFSSESEPSPTVVQTTEVVQIAPSLIPTKTEHPTVSPTSEPTKTPTAVPTSTATAIPPTPTFATTDISELNAHFAGNCAALERPLTYTSLNDGSHELMSLTTNERCIFHFPEGITFTFNRLLPQQGIYGTVFVNNQARLMHINFDGSIQDLDIVVGGFFGTHIYSSIDESQLIWSDGDGDPDNSDNFIAKLWAADLDGSNKRVIYEYTTDLSTAYLANIFFPIGTLPDGDVLFSIEPAGRGGGWIYVGDYSNIYRTSTITETTEDNNAELIFSCSEQNPFCVGDFSADLSLFAATDRAARELFIKEIETGNDIWRTTIPGDTFIGRPKFNQDKDLAFVIVDVIDGGNLLYPENGRIGWIDFPYDGFEQTTPAEQIANLTAWVDDETFVYYEMNIVAGERETRYPLLKRSGEETGVWQGNGRFPVVLH